MTDEKTPNGKPPAQTQAGQPAAQPQQEYISPQHSSTQEVAPQSAARQGGDGPVPSAETDEVIETGLRDKRASVSDRMKALEAEKERLKQQRAEELAREEAEAREIIEGAEGEMVEGSETRLEHELDRPPNLMLWMLIGFVIGVGMSFYLGGVGTEDAPLSINFIIARTLMSGIFGSVFSIGAVKMATSIR